MIHSPVESLDVPIIVAPMAGGPSVPDLVVAAARAGGMGQLAAGYKSVDAVRAEVEEVRAAGDLPFGVNVFVPDRHAPAAADLEALARYAERLQVEAERLRVELPTPRPDDDAFDDKVDLLLELAPPMVSFTFGLPPRDVVTELREAGSSVWVTVTNPRDARSASLRGVDGLIVQSHEAGGHRSTFTAAEEPEAGHLADLLEAVAGVVDLPLVGAGGIGAARDVAEVLEAGAVAVQVGTLFLPAAEAGTSRTYRDALHDLRMASTCVTRVYTGRPARGLRNEFVTTHKGWAPPVYPQVHQLTAPLRQAAGLRGDRQLISLWAGTAHQHAVPGTTAEIYRRLWGDGATSR